MKVGKDIQTFDIIPTGRASHPVVRAAFKAVEVLLKCLVGSTPTSSATPPFTDVHQRLSKYPKLLIYGYFLSIMGYRHL